VLLGSPLCSDCYDYEGSVLWNATCPELWRRTTIYVRRQLAKIKGLCAKEFSATTRLSFTKVAEFQRRGVVHLHAIFRLDSVDGRELYFDVEDLATAIRMVAAEVWAPIDHRQSLACTKWGGQLDVRPINVASDGASGASARAVANYLAKYATKSADEFGALDRRLNGLDDLQTRNVSDHLKRLVATAWHLGSSPRREHIRHWAHSLGFAGHWLTKSRSYSVTFKTLRAERQTWQVERGDVQCDESDRLGEVATISAWIWAGSGWRNGSELWMSEEFRRERDRSRIEAREALCQTPRAGRE
jgi:hypothetical protein